MITSVVASTQNFCSDVGLSSRRRDRWMDAILHRRSYSVPTDLSSMKSTVVTQRERCSRVHGRRAIAGAARPWDHAEVDPQPTWPPWHFLAVAFGLRGPSPTLSLSGVWPTVGFVLFWHEDGMHSNPTRIKRRRYRQKFIPRWQHHSRIHVAIKKINSPCRRHAKEVRIRRYHLHRSGHGYTGEASCASQDDAGRTTLPSYHFSIVWTTWTTHISIDRRVELHTQEDACMDDNFLSRSGVLDRGLVSS
jgi:hypothetical protein